MPLENPRDPFVDPGTLDLQFAMDDIITVRKVRVSVSPDVLVRVGCSGNPVDTFEAHREALGQLASVKFDATGGGTVVTLANDDLVS